jgi:orotidine 5'-phosphate decarboxylase subfamily 1
MEVKDHVCGIKYHSDMWSLPNRQIFNEWIKQQYENKTLEDVMIFEDRKFADIGAIVQRQFDMIGDTYAVEDNLMLLDLVTVIPIAGEGTIKAIRQQSDVGIMLVSQLSSADNLIDTQFTQQCVKMAKTHKRQITGFICQKRVHDDDRFVYMTPGVHISNNTDQQDQQYRTPEEAIIRDECDVIIVGRGITHNPDPKAAAQLYQQRGYQAYLKRFE